MSFSKLVKEDILNMQKDYFKTLLQYCIPQHTLSRFIGWFTNCRCAGVKNLIIKKFVAHYQVDMSSAIQTDPFQYATFNDFFTRTLKPEARPIDHSLNSIVSPADGVVSQMGKINHDKIFQAKGFDFTLLELLGGNEEFASPFYDGNFMTVYLAPKDYHRVHMPVAGELKNMMHVPGKLFSVNQITTEHVSRLFARNERVITFFNTEQGPMAVILVGAMIVASIHIAWEKQITPLMRKKVRTWQYGNEAVKSVAFKQGDEIGHFQLGSTVIVLFGKDKATWSSDLKAGSPIKMGERIGECTLLN